ncbi:hypothetical protein DY000_02006529 [Brassica cretica]|uniref:Uncharacterized protein n=1 Tax=Brassica cretica TaxID=69181 RepID=A0ABQ7CDP7_BRACR|nr:hypothetical protein DY000_02006529 [Brassica cretica]
MEQSKSYFSRRGKQRKPGTWVITPTPAPLSLAVPVVVLARKAEYGPCEKPSILGSQGTPGPYASPRSQEETQGFPHDFGSYLQGSKNKKEARTLVQPRAHRGHYNFKNLQVPVKRSPDLNLRVPIRPQRSMYVFRKRIEPLCSLKHIGVITSLKNLRVPMRPQGFSYILKNLWVRTTISGFIIESMDSYTASGLKSRCQDLEKRPPDLQNYFGSPDDPRVLMQPPSYKINLQTPIVHILARNLLVYSLYPWIPSFNLRKERDHRLQRPTSIEKQA